MLERHIFPLAACCTGNACLSDAYASSSRETTRATIGLLINDFKQYEVSSWSKAGFESNHNVNYWQFGDFLGVGPGAHSKITLDEEISRFRKIKPLNGYIKKQTMTDRTILQGDELDMDLAMNILRIKNGINQDQISTLLPESFWKKYEVGVSEGLLLKNKVGATDRGYQYLNETIKLFF